MIKGNPNGSVQDEIVLSGSKVEKTLGTALPTKANLIGISDGTNIQAMQGNTQGKHRRGWRMIWDI